MIQEFKDFVNKGGVFEAAVGLILALAFAPVVQGLVDHIIMPVVARIFGKPSFDDLKIGLGGDPDPETGQEVAIEYGSWITIVVGFLLIALVIFFLVKAYNSQQPEAEEEEAGPSEIDLLTEIRDGLAK